MNAPAVVNVVLPAALAAQINTEHEHAFGKAREALAHARRAGELLLQAKATVGHGAWLPWVEANCKFSVRTVQGYMRLASQWDQLQSKCATDAHLPLRKAMLAITAATATPQQRTYRIPYERRRQVAAALGDAVASIRRAATDLKRAVEMHERLQMSTVNRLRKLLADAVQKLDRLECEAATCTEQEQDA